MKTDIRTGPAPEHTPWYDQWILDSGTRKFMALIEYPYLSKHGAHTAESLREHREGREEVEANARLIAAAPDLLAALQEVAEALESHPVFGNFFTCSDGRSIQPRARVLAAIIKATL